MATGFEHAQLAGTAAATEQPTTSQRVFMRDPQQTAIAEIASFELPTFGADPRSIDGASEHAARILAEARATAADMVQQARDVRDAEIEAARQEGRELGYREGLELADRECAGLVAAAESIAGNVSAERERLLAEAEGEIVELAIAIAERVVNASLDVEPERVVDVCRGAMRKAFQRERLVVLAHPDDLELLRAAGPAMQAELGGIHELDFTEERRLQRGSVIVRTPVGEIDATFAAKTTKLEEGLRELVESRRAERRAGA